VKFFFLLPVLLFPACSKSPTEVSAAGQSARTVPAADEPLAATERHHETTLIGAAGALVRRGDGLSAELTLRCWREEPHRIVVREACVLAWSTGTDSSAELDRAIHEALAAGPTPNLAIAVARRASFAEGLSAAELASVLSALGNSPAWLRARVLSTWLAKHPGAGFDTAHGFWKVAALPSDGAPGLVGDSYRAAATLGDVFSAPLLDRYCPESLAGISRSRCFRFLSALVDPRTGEGFPDALRAFLPRRYDPEWLFFVRAFPERARLLERYL
jgi:hypothetical protein